MAQGRDRVIALVLAITFFVSSAGVSGLVIWELVKKDDKPKASQELKMDAPKLKGTKLADFTPVAKVESLQKIDLTAGDGAEVKPGDTVVVDYTGANAATGEIFESSLDKGEPLTTPLSGVIAGWQEGVPGMKVGGKRRLLIPAGQAYGDADLVFDVTLVKIGAQ